MFRNLTFLIPLNSKILQAELSAWVQFEFLKNWGEKHTVSFYTVMNVFSLVLDMLKPYT